MKTTMRRVIAGTIERITFRRVRFLWPLHGAPQLGTIWTPWTYGFQSGGWVHLDPRWLARTHRAERARRKRVAEAKGATA